MSETTVTPVSGRSDLREFIMLPFRLYEGVDQWVPPLISERKRHLDREHNPFFDHADAEYFLARRDGRVVGRITAQVDQRFNEFQDNDWGQFGFFESRGRPGDRQGAPRRRLRTGCARAAATTRSDRSTSRPTTSAGCSSRATSCDRRSSRTGTTPTTRDLLEGYGLTQGDGPLQVEPPRDRPQRGDAGPLRARREARARARDHDPRDAHATTSTARSRASWRSTTPPGRRTGASCR